jgi:hypothetical protein
LASAYANATEFLLLALDGDRRTLRVGLACLVFLLGLVRALDLLGLRLLDSKLASEFELLGLCVELESDSVSLSIFFLFLWWNWGCL